MAMVSVNNHLISALFSLSIILLSSLSHHRADSALIPSRRSLRANSTAVIAEFLQAHNTVRSQHGLSRLIWSTSLANYAKW